MIDEKGDPFVVEFNIRFGDPETQIVLPKLKTDLLGVLVAISNQTLDQIKLDWNDGYSVCIVMASEGYPGAYKKGLHITGLNDSSDDRTFVYHAGTSLDQSGDTRPMVVEPQCLCRR